MGVPTIVSGSITDNDYMIITFSEGVYTNSAHNLPVAVSDFSITLGGSGTGASAVSISGIAKSDGSALSPTGGENSIRILLSWVGSPNGNETVTISPASASSIYNAGGEAMSDLESTAPIFSIGIPSITITVGTDSYISLYDADIFFSKRLNTAIWDASSDADKAKALIMAAEQIDSMRFRGTKSTLNQALQFPRTYYSFVYRGFITDGTIPEDVKKACCLIAQDLLEGTNPSTRNQLQVQGVKRITIGNVSEEYTGVAPQAVSNPEALVILKKYTVNTVPVI